MKNLTKEYKMSNTSLIKKLSDDTGDEIVRTEKYVKDLKKFRAVINPRTAPRKKKKNKSVNTFVVSKNNKIVVPNSETTTGYKTEIVSTSVPNNETNITIAS